MPHEFLFEVQSPAEDAARLFGRTSNVYIRGSRPLQRGSLLPQPFVMELTAQLVVIVPLLIVVIDAARRVIQRRRERKGLPLPPGPTQIPVVGNAHSINREEPWKTYTKWHAIYGE